MQINVLSTDYAVSPQIDPSDLPAIASKGYTTVICNRPDTEIPQSHHAVVLQEAAQAVGLEFVIHPVSHPTIGPDTIDMQMQFIANSKGPVLAYCASGTRSSILWAFGSARTQPVDEILNAAAKAGYDLSPMRPQLEAFANSAPR